MEYRKIKVLHYILYVAKNEEGITYIDFEDNLKFCFKNIDFKKSEDNFEVVKIQLEEYFLGKRKEFDFKYNLIGSEFSLKVWNLLKEIPYGKKISYSEIAKKIGDIKKTRAVARAIGKNPLLIVIPCHRVLGKDGKLRGFRSGLDIKKMLLKIEKII